MRAQLDLRRIQPYLDAATKKNSGAPRVYPANIPSLFSELMNEGYCTMRELEEYYSYTDVLDMYEALTVRRLNEYVQQEFHSRKYSRSRG